MRGERQNTSSTANAVPLLPLEKANVQTDVREKAKGRRMRGGRGDDMRREQAPALQYADGSAVGKGWVSGPSRTVQCSMIVYR